MENFFDDNPDLKLHFGKMDLSAVIRLKENGFSDAALYPEAPADEDEAVENYRRVLELTGQICGEDIAPLAPDVDEQGASFSGGAVSYAPGTVLALKRLAQAGLMGMTLPRRFGGLNLPKTIYMMAIEMVSRADASLMNLFGLQDISETINHFGSDQQRERYLPLFASGRVSGAMALTEPDAGSDLPSAKLKAWQDEDGNWYLNGVKRFITNGCADVVLVMGRSEADIDDARGLSLFIYRKDSGRMKIRRIEEKLGIHGSPTCELQFDDAPAELLGLRKRGLIKYTMALMNGARLAVAAQALGIAEASFREANAYAMKRIQFGQTINKFEPVYEMLAGMRVDIEAGRSLLYETSLIVDMRECLDAKIEEEPDLKKELKGQLRSWSQYEKLFTPLVKCWVTEMGNRLCYNAIQVHGGVGYTTSFNSERHYRDIRITNIYEGTSQLQVLAAVGPVLQGFVSRRLEEYEKEYPLRSLGPLFDEAQKLRSRFQQALGHLQEKNDEIYQKYHSRRLVDMAADTIIGYLMCIDSLGNEDKKLMASLFIARAAPASIGTLDLIRSDDRSLIELYEKVLSPEDGTQ